jgi:hypothetical protein
MESRHLKSQSDSSTAKISSTLESNNLKDKAWVKDAQSCAGDYYYFHAKPLEIAASPADVWKYVLAVDQYHLFSHGAITAYVDGVPEEHKSIGLDLYKGQLLGLLIPHSDEVITLVDANQYIIGWQRKLMCAGFTERYQWLEPTIDKTTGAEKTLSYIALKVPGLLFGGGSKLLFGKYIEGAFDLLNAGIKEEAEKAAPKIS